MAAAMLEGWIEFRRHETAGLLDPPLVCCICGGEAEGNASFSESGEDICDRCCEHDCNPEAND